MTHVSDPTDLDPDQPVPDIVPESYVDVDVAAPVESAAAVETGATVDLAPAGYSRPVPRFFTRIGKAIVRRPLDWIDAPWTVQRVLRTVTAFLFLLVAGIITKNVVHWDLVTTSNTPTGGDMGAHVMAPAYLRDHLLDNFQLTGWNPYWYDGFPLYRFYMVIPALMIVFLNIFTSYGIAFKIVVVSGIMTLPICCWAFGRLAKFRYPMPELFSIAALIFLLDDSKDLAILGGTVKSTMAGEFSFSIALSFAMLGLGLFAKGLETGKYRGRTAVILALAVLSHGIVAIFVMVGVILMAIVWMDKTRLKYTITTLLPMGLLTAFWILPFTSGSAYMTDMKYEGRPSGPNDSYWRMFFPLDVTLDRIIAIFAIIGFLSCVKRRHLTGAWMGITILALGLLCRFTQQNHTNLPVIGLLWNPRILPFINLLRYLLMMVGIAEVGRGIVWVVCRVRVGMAVARERREGRTGAAVPMPTATAFTIGSTITAFFTLVVVLLMLAVEFQLDFFGGGMVNGRYSLSVGSGKDQLVLYRVRSTATRGLADSWSRYNFTGYEGKPAYGEYRQLVDDMAAIGSDPSLGCGRALWENNGDNGRYGTTMALMLLPHWTDGCIDSSEGLFFEASGTTPYHFLTTAAMSTNSSNPVRQLRYTDSNPAVGVPYMQELGIRYYMAWTDQAVAKADQQPDLRKIKISGPWHIYEVLDSDIITPLTMQPVVVGRGEDREKWLELGTSYFQNNSDWTAVPAADGPKEWQRVDAVVDPSRSQANRVDVVVPSEPITPVALAPVQVSNVVLGNESVDFDVDQVGVPVLVKVSYFPNWEVSGGKGPYRIAPNLMVVIPTSKHVTMNFGRSTTDYIAYLLTLIGVVLLFVFKRFVPIHYRSADPFDPFPASMRVPAGVGAAGGDFVVAGEGEEAMPADWTPTDPLLVPLENLNRIDGHVDDRVDDRVDDPVEAPTVAPAVEPPEDTRADAGPGTILDDFEPPR
jgi:6-pyruvoyl-tetrahydropterin synthase related domain